ncbi:DUF6913 domain-containing protein [Reichenbachiella ulvae]|uniref:Uncharacterized protein n=1 Tax=Reichenbachiella ulvae TaxID=2980104 RepID=A0ABT3CQ38_9BACT|nr:hypothetical protein [Reichenbachiella ulvae]MCV9385681.1 hypothetical protein [Reichenbachiella ulvae]
MIGKYLVKLKTRFALRKKSERGSKAYQDAKRFGILYTYSTEKNHKLVYEWIEELTQEGKSVQVITFIPKTKKKDNFDYPFFSERHLKSNGKWSLEIVEDFKEAPFDYLLSLDKGLDKYTMNILATSKAKCRVGLYAEGVSQYFEMMINHEKGDFRALLSEVHHYLKELRNEQ